MKRVLLAMVFALGVSGGAFALWQLSEQMSHTEIDAHLRAEASALRNRILAELRAKEGQADNAISAIQARQGAWERALAPYPSPLLRDDELETKWLSARVADVGLPSTLPKHTAFGFLHDQGRTLTFTASNGETFTVPHRGNGLYRAPGSGRIWLGRAVASLDPAPLSEVQGKIWVALELDDAWFADLALQTQTTLVVMGPSGVVRSHGPADLVASLIERLGSKRVAPLLADHHDGMAGARIGLSGDLAILAMATETNDIRHIEKRYSEANMFMIAGVGASFIVLLLWLAIAGRGKRRPPEETQGQSPMAPARERGSHQRDVYESGGEIPAREHGFELARTTEVKPPSHLQPAATSRSQQVSAVSSLQDASGPHPRNTGVCLGRYQILARIGEGGMAEVFSAVNLGVEGFHRIFVLKRLKPHLMSHEGVVNQFIDEAKLAASLQHTNILSVLDFGCDADQYFMVTDHVWGRNIGQLIEQAQKRGLNAIPQHLALYLTHELLQGLQYAHCQTDAHGHPRNIVHRDVSVNNVMVNTEGDVKLLDFGIAKAHERSSNTTEQGVIKGNVLYMSPEQAQGLHVDHRSDIFSAGLVLLSMLTGHAPYRGTSQFKVLMEAARGPQDVQALLGANADPHLVAMLQKALHVDPDFRYQTAGEFASDLRMFPISDRFAAAQFLTALFGDQLEHEKREVELAIQALPPPEHALSGSHVRANSA